MDQEERLRAALADRYRIEREIGSGGMATVYLAEDRKHGRKVAVKVLNPELARGLGTERFLREIRTVANLTHPHILPVFDSGEADGFLYFVMPFILGETLRERLSRDRRLPIEEAVRLLRDVVDGLAAAHRMGVVHRDIKPENVLISDSHAMLADFGVARAVSQVTGHEKLTMAGVALGTPSYMAPEQATAEEAMDHRADIYAAGAMAYELLTGRPPFSGKSSRQILAAQVMESPQPVRELRPSVPQALSDLVMRCLEKEPEDRWQRAEEMLPHLEAASTPSASRPPGLIEGTGEGSEVETGSKKARIAGMSLLLLAVATGIWAVTKDASMSSVGVSGVAVPPAGESNEIPEADLPRIVVLPFENRSDREEDDLVCSMLAEWTARTMDQTKALDIVPPTVVNNSFRGADEPFSGMVIEVARETGARYALSGSVRRLETSIQFEAQLLDAGSGALVQAFEPVSGPADSVEAVLARAAEAFATGCLYALGPGKEKWLFDYYTPPPNLEAYEAYKSAVDAACEVRWDMAVEALHRAHSLAPSWPSPLIDLITGLRGVGRHQERDSVLELLRPMLPRMTPMERYRFDWQTAQTRYERFRAADKMFQHDPMSWGYAMAGGARSINRLHRAKEGMLGLDLDNPCNRTAPPIWAVGAQIFHLLGEEDAALGWAQDGRARFPGNPSLIIWEARVQAALGSLAQVRSLADTLRSLPVSTATVMGGLVQIGLELEVQDKPVASRTFLEEALTWVDKHPDVSPFQKGRLLYYLERYGEALPLLQEVARERPTHESLGYLALCLDGLGYDARADSVMAETGAGPPSRYPALLAARRGNVRKAVDLLRSSFEAGMTYHSLTGPGQIYLDLDPELNPIRNHASFQALMRPVG